MNNDKNHLPHLFPEAVLEQAFGFSRTRPYEILNMKEAGFVVQIGRRKYILRDNFLKWLDEKTKADV